MTEEMEPKDAVAALISQSVLIEPGAVMFVIIHTGDEGIVPPPEDAPEDTPGVGEAHSFGPFVSKAEAEAWQDMMNTMSGECDCRKAVVPVAVPRLLGLIGPPAIPVDVAAFVDELHAKDRLN
jgi:hypothetical protein